MQIVALGGGGFLMEPENPLLDDFILSLARNRSPRVCFVPTAAGDSENLPHYDGEPNRRPTYHKMIAAGLSGGYAADDGCALYFENGKLKEVVSSRKAAKAYRVDLIDGKVREEPIESMFFG